MGLARFKSLTLRCFKLPLLEDRCEEYGQFATYLGTLRDTPGAFVLDGGHTFEKGRATPVCGNTAFMVRIGYGGEQRIMMVRPNLPYASNPKLTSCRTPASSGISRWWGTRTRTMACSPTRSPAARPPPKMLRAFPLAAAELVIR